MILEIIEPYLEVANLILAIIIVLIGFMVASRLEGRLKKAWNSFLIAITLFGIHEIVGSLAEFGLFELDGLYALTEFIFILAFLISTLLFKKLFAEISSKKGAK